MNEDGVDYEEQTPTLKGTVMNIILNAPEPHPLKAVITNNKITLWQLRKALGGEPSEAKLSRILNGIDNMPKNLEIKIKQLIR
jgi:hypothetical protein